MPALHLSGYQRIELEQVDLGDQWTQGGTARRTLVAKVTTAMDEPFVNHTVTVLLKEEDQRRIIAAFTTNLQGKEL